MPLFMNGLLNRGHALIGNYFHTTFVILKGYTDSYCIFGKSSHETIDGGVRVYPKNGITTHLFRLVLEPVETSPNHRNESGLPSMLFMNEDHCWTKITTWFAVSDWAMMLNLDDVDKWHKMAEISLYETSHLTFSDSENPNYDSPNSLICVKIWLRIVR